MLSGLFKRKDKKPKASNSLDSFDSDAEKVSEEFGRSSPQSRVMDEGQPEKRPSSDKEPVQSPQRQQSKGKLQKQQRSRDTSPTKNKRLDTDSPEPTASPNSISSQTATAKEAPNAQPSASQAPVSTGAATMRLVPEETDTQDDPPTEARVHSPENSRGRSNSAASKLNPINILNRQPSDREARPEKVRKAKQRVQLDDFDSPLDEQEDPFADPKEEQKKLNQGEPDVTGRLSESPVQISPSEAQPPEKEIGPQGKAQAPDPSQPPGLTGDTSSQETNSPISTPPREQSPSSAPSKPSLAATRQSRSPSPTSLIQNPAIPQPSRPAPVPSRIDTSPPDSSSSSLPAWSDISLRTYLDDGSDIKDMLVVIHDTSGIAPVGPEHPIMAGLFVEERKAMLQLGGELDSLLGDWIERKRKARPNPAKLVRQV